MSVHPRRVQPSLIAVHRNRLLPLTLTAIALSPLCGTGWAQQAPAPVPPVAQPQGVTPLPSPGAQPQPPAATRPGGTSLPPVVVAPPKAAPKAAATQPAPARKAPAAKAAPARKAAPAPAIAAAAPASAASPEPTAEPGTPATALGSYNPALDLPTLTLPPGTTLTTAGPVQGYRALSAMSATKTATPLEQIPQSIQVVPRSVIEDQHPVSVTEATQNVSSVQGVSPLNIGNTEMQQYRIRGFGAELWLDGMVMNYVTGDRDAFANVERIEVLKGPSAILYGGGAGAPIGGAINIVSKLPTDKAFGEIGGTIGSHSYYRPYFDVNQPLIASGNILFRMTGEYSSADSFVDVLHSERYSLNPTLVFTDKTNTTLTIQGRMSRFEQQAYPGLPAVGTVAGNFRIDRKIFAGDQDIMPSYTKVQGITVTLDHKFDSIWSFNVKARWSKSEFDQNSQGTFTAAPDLGPTTWSLLNTEVFQRQQEFSINPNVTAKFQFGPTKNTLLFGADYSRVTDKGFMNSDLLAGFVDLANPIFPFPYRKPDPLTSGFFFPFFDFDSTYVTKGAYAQLQSTIYDRIHVLAGVRAASIDIDYFEKVPFGLGGFAPPELFKSSDTKLLPRAGVVIDLVKGLSVYASYSEGMRATGFTQAYDVAPELSKQREAGIKFNLAHQLSGTLAVYEIQRENVPDIVGVGVGRLTSQEGKGFEADLLWQPSRHWSVLANYGYVDAKYAEDYGATPKGNHLPFVAQHSGRLWINHAFAPQLLKGWSVGAGVYVSSGDYVDSANVYKTNPYFTIDAKVGYENDRFKAALHMKNLTDEHYFKGYSWFGGQVATGDERAYYATFAVKY